MLVRIFSCHTSESYLINKANGQVSIETEAEWECGSNALAFKQKANPKEKKKTEIGYMTI